MRIFEEEEYEQPAVYRDRDRRNNAERASFYAEVQEAHEYDEEGLAERVVEEAEVPLVEPRDRRARSDGVHFVTKPERGQRDDVERHEVAQELVETAEPRTLGQTLDLAMGTLCRNSRLL